MGPRAFCARVVFPAKAGPSAEQTSAQVMARLAVSAAARAACGGEKGTVMAQQKASECQQPRGAKMSSRLQQQSHNTRRACLWCLRLTPAAGGTWGRVGR